MSGPDDTFNLVEYESECPVAPNGKHDWRFPEGFVGRNSCRGKVYQECARCSAVTEQRKLLD